MSAKIMTDATKKTEIYIYGCLDVDTNDIKIETLGVMSNTVSLADVLRCLNGKIVDITITSVDQIK